MKSPPRIYLVVGPTASGKSDLAQEIALREGGEVLNADSQQFYRGLDIGTAKLKTSERRVKHWLLDQSEPGEFMTAGAFAREAENIISELQSRGTTPVLAGGTGLYVRALVEGLDPLPPRDETIRKKLKEEFANQGGEAMHRRLNAIDPRSAAKIHPQDPARLIRFLEIFELSGKAPSSLMSLKRPDRLRFVLKTFWLKPDRPSLRKKIEARVQNMVEEGWLAEVEALMEGGRDPRTWLNKPIGYGEMVSVVLGKKTLAEVVSSIIQKTQQYAKRQETFWRGYFQHPPYRIAPNELNEILI